MEKNRFSYIVLASWALLSLTSAFAAAPPQTYRFVLEEEPKNLSTTLKTDVYTHAINRFLNAGLLRTDDEDKLQPALAEVWEVSADGKEYRIQLKKDARFRNGELVTAEDVVASLSYVLSSAVKSPYAKRAFSIVGAEDYYYGKTDHIAGLQVVDQHTVKIVLHEVDSTLLYRFAAWPAFAILPKDQIELGQADVSHEGEVPVPMGAGPYMVEKWVRGESLLLVQSPHHYDAENVGIPRIEILFDTHPLFKEKTVEQAFIDGELDHLLLRDDMTQLLNQLAATDSPFQKLATPSHTFRYYGLRTTKPPLDDVRVRQALNYAYNNDSVKEGDRIESYLPLYGIILQGMPGHSDGQRYQENTQKARDLLAEAGYADLSTFPELVLSSIDDNYEKIRAQKKLGEQLNALGIRTRFVSYPGWPEFKQAILDDEVHIFPVFYRFDYAKVEEMFSHLFHSDGGFNNTNAYNTPSLDKLIDQGRSEQGFREEVEINQQIEEIVLDAAPVIPRFSPVEHIAFSARVLNPVVSRVSGHRHLPRLGMKLKE